MRYPAVEELISRGIPESDWDWYFDESKILAEIRLARYEIQAEYNFDPELRRRGSRAKSYAAGSRATSIDGVVREAEPPEDLTGLFPNPENFISEVKLRRAVAAKHVADLDAYNDDARRRAVRLGFPPESFVLKKEEIDYRPIDEIMAETRASEPED
jgi:hypothetical protein